MFRQLFKRLSGTRFSRYVIEKAKQTPKTSSTRSNTLKPATLLFGSVFCKSRKPESLMSFDADIGTWSENESTIMNLMTVLKESVIGASQEYRNCLKKQIEITATATKLGHFSEKWDDLPEYRILGDQLKQELEKYFSLIKTLGKLATDESLSRILPKPEESLRAINLKYKELEEILIREIDENRQLEMELLRVKRDSILSLSH